MTTPVQGQPDVTTDPSTQPPVVTDPPANDPPYKNYLDEVPDAFKSQAEEVFKKWDADVTQRFQSLHSEYDPYKPVIDEYAPEALQQATTIVQYMQDNPQEFIQWFMQQNGISPEQGTAVTTTPQQQALPPVVDESDPYAAKFSELEQGIVTVLQMLQGQQQNTIEQQQQQELENIIAGLHDKHGDFNDIFVLTMIGNGLDPESAVGAWKQELTKYGVSANSTAPTVVSAAGGGHAVEQITAADLASGKVKSVDIVAQMLKNANEQTG